MNFFVLESEIVNEQQATLTTVKQNYNEANMLFHQILASAYANKNLTYALVVIINESGTVLKKEIINVPKSEPEKKEQKEEE